MKTASFVLLASILLSLGACAASPDDDGAISQESALRQPQTKKKKSGCGPVRWEGVGTSENKAKAYAAAEEEARRICVETPSFCGLDCDGAPVVAADCVHYVVNDDPKLDEYYECTVTIEASGL